MTDRLLTPNERMTDMFDRAATMNFTVVARVHGALTSDVLRTALRKLEARHPLLRAGIVRDGKRSRFVANGAAEISFVEREAPVDAWRELAARSLDHRTWRDEGPRAELIVLRHGAEDSTLLLTFHHTTSDGSSGVYAMRDLLAFAADPAMTSQVVPSPGTTAFFPRGHGGLLTRWRALRMIAGAMGGKQPKRFRQSEPIEDRRTHLARFKLDADTSLAIARRARTDGATVHGALSAALSRALSEHFNVPTRQRLMHPVCLRRFMTQQGGASPGEAFGCYVSSVDSDHEVHPAHDLGALAREVTTTIQRKKRDGFPLLTAPIAGPMLADRYLTREPAAFRAFAEGKIMFNTFGITNLGRLEDLNVRERVGALTIEDLFFVAAGTVGSALGASATSLGGAISMQVLGTAPAVAPELIEKLAQRTEALLRAYV